MQETHNYPEKDQYILVRGYHLNHENKLQAMN